MQTTNPQPFILLPAGLRVFNRETGLWGNLPEAITTDAYTIEQEINFFAIEQVYAGVITFQVDGVKHSAEAWKPAQVAPPEDEGRKPQAFPIAERHPNPYAAESTLHCLRLAVKAVARQYGGAKRMPPNCSIDRKFLVPAFEAGGISSAEFEKVLDMFRKSFPCFDFETRADLWQIRPARGFQWSVYNGIKPTADNENWQ